jgi:hypothetical protein
VVWQWLVQVIAQIPADTQPIRRHLDKLSLRTQPLKEYHQLELEKDDWINRGSAKCRICVFGQVAQEAEVKFG